MDLNVEQNKRRRKVLRTVFTKNAGDLEALLTSSDRSPVSLRDIQVSWELLVQKHDNLTMVDRDIYEALLADDATEEGSLLTEMDLCENYERKFTDLKIRYNDVASHCQQRREEDVQSVRSEASNVTGRRKFKLPTIEFKKFDGNIREWLSFWAQFKKIHDDPDIALEDKIEYLTQATVPGSRARQLVDSFPAIGKNYEKIVQGLEARFGREDLQIEVYVRELLKLILHNARSQNHVDIFTLYDKLESQMRALETLGVTSEKCSAMLFPLIESCLPEDLLRVWQRVGRRTSTDVVAEELGSSESLTTKCSLEGQLKDLMNFLKREVENEQRIFLAKEGFDLCPEGSSATGKDVKRRTKPIESTVATASTLVSCDVAKCVFCEGSHASEACFNAQNFTLEHKREILANKRACFKCLKIGHQAKRCRIRLKCIVCAKPHVPLICPNLPAHTRDTTTRNGNMDNKGGVSEQALANNTDSYVFLETLRVRVNGRCSSQYVRVLIDTGSQRSYIMRSTAQQLGNRSKRRVKIVHCLFGGVEQIQTHECFDVKLSAGDFSCTLEVLDQPMICKEVSPVFEGPWMEEINALNVQLSDVRGTGDIELLIGADYAGRLYTGRRHILKCGLILAETFLGWTLSGRMQGEPRTSVSMAVLSLFVKECRITDFWQLDVIGITEPSEKRTREEMALAAKDFFLQTVTKDESGRYEIRLPWLDEHPTLPSNYHLAKKRLESVVRKLKNDGLFEAYDRVFQEWLQDDIIEEVDSEEDIVRGHYLPHRPVLKEHSTTRIRPVFDASARDREHPSLNHCLEKGENLIELIPTNLLRFREQRFGVISDIRKAFLQIGVYKTDRDFLKFLWTDFEGKEKVYRHRRVVFGVNCSPFLLGATIQYHLGEKLKQDETTYSRKTISKLLKSFYVDNCVTSVASENDLNQFILESSMLMAEAKFDLRGWESTLNSSDINVAVLGLTWNTKRDVLMINSEWLKEITNLKDKTVTKRFILSTAQKIFDPIGYVSPTTLIPKILLQRTWEQQMGWDTIVDPELERVFKSWLDELPYLQKIEIPRWICAGPGEGTNLSLHTFCDASKNAYATVVFLRVEQGNRVSVRLLAAKSRVAPLKKVTIPRLELLAATIGARLTKFVLENLEKEIEYFCWSDSSTVISWIRRQEPWAPFVGNRIVEIRSLTFIEAWRHVPGDLDPADLPSRGCSAKDLLESKWWEGPKWLLQPQSLWVQENLEYNELEVNKERKRNVISCMCIDDSSEWHFSYFSKYNKILRMMAWILRFKHNLKNATNKHSGPLTAEEINIAEEFVFKVVQQETFTGPTDKTLCSLNPFYDEHQLLRLKSYVSNRPDVDSFRYPVVLSAKHPVVRRLVFDVHEQSCHLGTQGLLSLLREKFWIIGGRRAIRSIINKCVVCKRYNGTPCKVATPPLPLSRVRDAALFEVTGIDFAGPLFLKTNDKVWVCLFTCAVYRAVHLELCTSLSTATFLQALRRFVARRGRPRVIYSDNGTNFVGTENAFSKIDWKQITETTSVQRILWRFNPPSSPWWGGFWERLIGMTKGLLRKVLGRSCLNFEDLMTLICDCESIINSRPLTYMSDEPKDLAPLTPMMFLRDLSEDGLPECDAVDRTSLCRRIIYNQKLRESLRSRFRNEYLGALKNQTKSSSKQDQVSVGQVVLVGNNHDKRLNWPLARIVELIPGKDGTVRLVRVNTDGGELLRTLQNIYPLECSNVTEFQGNFPDEATAPVDDGCPNEDNEYLRDCAGVHNKSKVPVDKVFVTRSGRSVKRPCRFMAS